MKIEKYKAKANSEFSQRLVDRLVSEASDTPSMSQICARVGIPPRTLYNWLKRGREGDPRYAQFAQEFDAARAHHEGRALGNVWRIADDDNPKTANASLAANRFILQTFYPRQYQREATVNVVEQHQPTYNLAVLPAERLRTFHKLLKAVVAGEENGDEAERILAELPIDVEEEATEQAGE